MLLEIGDTIYTADTSAMTALRYRITYGASALAELVSATELATRLGVLAKLAAIAAGLDVKTVAVAMRQDKRLVYALEKLEREIFRADPTAPPMSDSALTDKSFDELDLLAASVGAGTCAEWWYELPVMHVSSVLARMAAAQGPAKHAPTRMSETEVAVMYNISPEQLKRAAAAQRKTAPEGG